MTKKKQIDQTQEVESTDEAAVETKKRRRRWPLVVLGLVVLTGGGAGGAVLANSAGLVRLPFLDKAGDPFRPRLVPRDHSDGTGFASTSGQEDADPRRYKASYYPIEKEFTSNLSDGESFVQVGLGVSTYYDERVFTNLQRHEMAVRSAVLLTLASHDPAKLSTPEGKIALQSQLKSAVNEVLRAKEGFGGIDGVYFTSFVMQ